MNKKLIYASVAVALVILAAVLGLTMNKDNKNSAVTTPSNNSKSTNKSTTKVNTEASISLVKAKLASVGAITNEDTPYFSIIGATDGLKFDVGSTNVEVYKFENNDKLAAGQKQLSSDDSTILTKDMLIVLVHSVDKTQADQIRNAIQ